MLFYLLIVYTEVVKIDFLEDETSYQETLFHIFHHQFHANPVHSSRDSSSNLTTISYLFSSAWHLSQPRVWTRKAGELRQAPREDQHQRPEFRD